LILNGGVQDGHTFRFVFMFGALTVGRIKFNQPSPPSQNGPATAILNGELNYLSKHLYSLIVVSKDFSLMESEFFFAVKLVFSV